jgi:hypothetical protein
VTWELRFCSSSVGGRGGGSRCCMAGSSELLTWERESSCPHCTPHRHSNSNGRHLNSSDLPTLTPACGTAIEGTAADCQRHDFNPPTNACHAPWRSSPALTTASSTSTASAPLCSYTMGSPRAANDGESPSCRSRRSGGARGPAQARSPLSTACIVSRSPCPHGVAGSACTLTRAGRQGVAFGTACAAVDLPARAMRGHRLRTCMG